jgi:hypothetical protein
MIAVAPDGRSVYVGGGGGWLSAFARDPATGLLTHVQTLRDEDRPPYRLGYVSELARRGSGTSFARSPWRSFPTAATSTR